MRKAGWIGGVILLVVVTFCLNQLWVMELVFTLAFGWVVYLTRVTSQAHVNWDGVGMGLLCLAGTIALGHWIGMWVWGAMRNGEAWQKRWTLMGLAAVMLLFVSGMAATGVVHQTGWLLHSEQPMTKSNFRKYDRPKCMASMRELGQAMDQYAKAHDGRLPESLGELSELDIHPSVFTCPASDDRPAEGPDIARQVDDPAARHCSYVYFGKGKHWPLGKDEPVLAEPLSNHAEDQIRNQPAGMNILFGDGEVRWCATEEARAILGKR